MTLPKPPSAARPNPNRRRQALLAAALSLQLLFSNFICSAQEPTPTPVEDEEVVSVRTDLVVVPVFITDERGRRVSGLTQADFQVRDNGRPVEMSYFAAGADSVALLFLLDASGSTRETITQQRETALALFSHFGARSSVAVMQFRERAELSQDFTRDLRAARKAFQVASLPDRRTAIFDAARAAVRAFGTKGHSSAERRIVVLVSDGLDTASDTLPASVVAEANAAGVSFYVVHLPLYAPLDGRLAARRPARGFRELAEKTGGQFFVGGDARTSLDARAEHDLSPIFRAITEDLQSQYVLGYHAGNAATEPGTHRVEVRLNSLRDRKLRVRQLRETYEPKR
ncbi:MAG: Ca-activated chloride channel [Acidobacteriota bacterium]|jgi:Ca-activated chloride channel family protein|nr:Ca-activated chloride channel [Acidobacteriota bacterium]